MNKKEPTTDRRQEPQVQSRRVRLPGFLVEEEIGLGDAIKRVTYAMGIKPCGGCEKRAAALNRWVHRALNYLAVRYPAIYATAADAFARNASLAAVAVRQSSLSGGRNIVDVIFSFTNRNTDVVEKFFTRVDVTEEFPFLVTKMSPYYDR